MDAFGDGEREMVPLFVAFLLVGRNGIMNQRLDAMLSEMLLQCIAVLTENGELMIDIVGIGDATGQRDQRVVNVLVIVGC